MSGPLVKGALASYLSTWPPVPVISVFQYNPERMVHSWSQPEPPGKPGAESNNPLAVRGLPGESFQFTIFLNADDDMVSQVPALQLAAVESGVGARLAALEMLLYPASGTGAGTSTATAGGTQGTRPGKLLGTVSAGLGGSSGSTWKLPNSTLPIVLFYWNPNRVVPVRVTSLSVTETLYDEDLNPRHAQAEVSLRVLTPPELAAANPAPATAASLAVEAYNQTYNIRRLWAAGSAASAAGMIASKLPR